MEYKSNTIFRALRCSMKIFAAFSFSLLMISNSGAQATAYAEDFLSSHAIQSKPSKGLDVLLTIEFNDMPVLDALEILAEKGDLDLNYNNRSLDQTVRIDRHFKDVSLLTAIQEVAEQAGIYFYISESGQLILTPRELPTNMGTLTGRVVDESSMEPLIGTTLYIVELERGAMADADGYFEIGNIPEGVYTLRVTSVGYQTQIQTVDMVAGQESEILIALEQDRLLLDEVVVTGYSVRQRSLPTGALTRVEGSDFRETLIQSPDQALQGRSSGVYVSHESGQPGSGLTVRVRGIGSIGAGNSPLYIVDGVQIRTDHTSALVPDNALSAINPNDIENIEVLKDASATALYGAQGANGVVLITTRQAQRGQTQINVSSQIGINEQPNKPHLMDGPTWTETMIQGYVNYYTDRGEDAETRRQMAIQQYGDPATAPTYDWLDALTRAGALQKYNVSAAAGLDNTRIRLSAGYDFEEGAAIASDHTAMRFLSNIDHSFSERFLVATRLSLANTKTTGLVAGSANINSPFHGGYTQRPIDAIYTEDGGYNHNDWIRVNMVQQLNENIRETKNRSLRGSITGIYQIMENLSFRSLWALDFRTVRDRAYTSALLPRYRDTGGSLTER